MNLNVITETRVRPFSNGSQHHSWEASNCERCAKCIPPEADYTQFRCDIQRAVSEAAFGDGTVSDDVARRMGYSDPLWYVWKCNEVEWTPEWITEARRRGTRRYRIAKKWRKIRHSVRKWVVKKRDELTWKIRKPIAVRACAPGKDGCWADWCTWAMGMSDKPEPGACRRCIREGEENGGCYCGQFPR